MKLILLQDPIKPLIKLQLLIKITKNENINNHTHTHKHTKIGDLPVRQIFRNVATFSQPPVS
jgi:hypothetical protein